LARFRLARLLAAWFVPTRFHVARVIAPWFVPAWFVPAWFVPARLAPWLVTTALSAATRLVPGVVATAP